MIPRFFSRLSFLDILLFLKSYNLMISSKLKDLNKTLLTDELCIAYYVNFYLLFIALGLKLYSI
jgi:hypothetical protein